jgi:hypothetical protein
MHSGVSGRAIGQVQRNAGRLTEESVPRNLAASNRSFMRLPKLKIRRANIKNDKKGG